MRDSTTPNTTISNISPKNKNMMIGCGVATSALLIGGAVAAGFAVKKHQNRKITESVTQNTNTNTNIPASNQNKPKTKAQKKVITESERVFLGPEFRRILDMIKLQIGCCKTDAEDPLCLCDRGILICQIARDFMLLEKDRETLTGLRSYRLRSLWLSFLFEKTRLSKEMWKHVDHQKLKQILVLFDKADHNIERVYHHLRNRMTLEDMTVNISPLEQGLNFVG
jgi:hypothetical protein